MSRQLELCFDDAAPVVVGSVVRTNYGTGPYVVRRVLRGCVCPRGQDELNCPPGERPPLSRPHMHLIVRKAGDRFNSYLNGYDEETLKSVWDDDRLEVVEVG